MRLRRSASLLRLRPAGAFATRALMLLALVALLTTLAVAAIGGFAFSVGGLRVRAHSSLLPGIVAFVLGAIALARGRDQLRAASTWWWNFVEHAAAAIACAAALLIVAVGWSWGTHVAGGSDSDRYLNEAELLASGRVRELQPIAADAPWTDAAWTFVPAGHAPAPASPGAIVPICPAGYPLIMAGARPSPAARDVRRRSAAWRTRHVARLRDGEAPRWTAGRRHRSRPPRCESRLSVSGRAADE